MKSEKAAAMSGGSGATPSLCAVGDQRVHHVDEIVAQAAACTPVIAVQRHALLPAWAAILFAPTFVATVYGMNFENMPEMTWDLGYPVALALMAVLGVALYVLFKRRNWM